MKSGDVWRKCFQGRPFSMDIGYNCDPHLREVTGLQFGHGNEIVNREPLPTALETAIEPPC